MTAQVREIKPQSGFQEQFINCRADIVWGGGAAGAGKSFALLLCYLLYVTIRNFGGVVFRRTYPQIKGEGGLWDSSESLFTSLPDQIRPQANYNSYSWTFPSKNQLSFSHLQHEKDKFNWQGTQISYLAFDELTQFSESQFWYLMSRLRSTSGFRPICRCTMNPQGDGWVKDFLLSGGYLYPDDYKVSALASFPVPEMAGKVRWFLRHKGTVIWGDTDAEVAAKVPVEERSMYTSDDVKSFAFMPGTLEDNPILVSTNPGYRGTLMALPEAERAQLLGGRWSSGGDDRLKLFASDALADLWTNDFVPEGEPCLTADIATEGSDLFVIGIWSGWRLEHVYTYPVVLGDEVLKEIKRMASRHGVPGRNIAFDAQGIGNYLKGFMRTSVAVSGSAKPYPIDGKKQNYLNLRSQLYFYTEKKVSEYEAAVLIPRNSDEGRQLYRELNVIHKVERKDGKLAIEGKDAIKVRLNGKSPDYADMFVLRAALDLNPRPKGKRYNATV